ncbi:hypothetical protein M3215_22780 [Bacillus cytotoxicus]|uniref:Uncharacterized protein n=1 Tax=Bacillus cytotoxicus TaxID=580165 RepID=A0ACC6AEQ4_9BACI|nr:hypothetical protein [Bacillus cytotoxicus]
MKLPIVNEKETLVMSKKLCYSFNDKKVGVWKKHKEHLEDRGWHCKDFYDEEGHIYMIYTKEIVKAERSCEM